MMKTVLVSAGVALVVALGAMAVDRALIAPSQPPAAEPAAGTPEIVESAPAELDREEVGQIVRDYLLDNPRLLEEVIDALEQEQAGAQAEAQRAAIVDNRDALLDPPHGYVAGNPEGDVTMVEFFDYNCPYCRQMVPVVMRLIDEDPDLRVILLDWPVLGEESVEASRIAMAVKRVLPDRYLEFHQALMQQRGRIDGDRAVAIAEEFGVDSDELSEAAAAAEIDTALQEAEQLGSRIGLRGTPSYIVGDEVLGGAVGGEMLREEIAKVREEGCAIC